MPRDHAQWREQLWEVGYALTDAVPAGWRRIDLRCKANVDVHDFVLTVVMNDGAFAPVDLPRAVIEPILRIRRAFYVEGEGTWFSMRYMMDPPGSIRTAYNLDWDPRWEPGIDPAGWARDLAAFPRDDEHLPKWLRGKLIEAGQRIDPEPPPTRPEGEPLDPEEQNALWGDIANLLALNAPPDWQQVMLTYRAVGDYTELPVFVRRASDGSLDLWEPPAEVPALLRTLRAGMYREGRGTWFETTGTVQLDSSYDCGFRWDDQPSWDGEPPLPELARELTLFPRDEDRIPAWLAERLGSVGAATLGGAADPKTANEEALRAAEDAAAELELDPGRYRVGEIAEGAWCLVPEGDRWAVFLARGGERFEQVMFGTAREAARYFVGHLYLNRPAFTGELPPDARRATEEWPIQPMDGDAGLQLYRGKRIVTLPPGAEVDRYGRPTGNTVYAARTEFPYRTEPAEVAEWEYHVYRLRRPVRAIVGTTVAWYDQPGGGTAYVLERSVADLLADEAIEEIAQATTRPPSPETGEGHR